MRGVAELDFFFSSPLREHLGVGQKAALISGGKKKKKSALVVFAAREDLEEEEEGGVGMEGGDIGAFPPKVTGGLCRFVKCCELDQFLR